MSTLPIPLPSALATLAAAALLLTPTADAQAQRFAAAWTDGRATVRVGATARLLARRPDRLVLDHRAARSEPVRVDGVAGGPVDGRRFGATCAGWVAAGPNHHVVVTAPVPRLRLVAEGPGTTLVVRGEHGRTWCAVDRDGAGAAIEGAFAPGTYDVHVGAPVRGARDAYRLAVWDRPDQPPPRWERRPPVLSPAVLLSTRWEVALEGRPTDVVAFRRNGRVVGSLHAHRWAVVGDVLVVKDRRFRTVARLRAAPGPDGVTLRGRLAPALGGQPVALRAVGAPGWRGAAPPPRGAAVGGPAPTAHAPGWGRDDDDWADVGWADDGWVDDGWADDGWADDRGRRRPMRPGF